MSKIEVNAVEPQCGTTLTLGASGDTVTLGSGASQSGFGRTGTVDWQTTKKTASFTAVSGEGYFVDTSSGAITATLPASPSAGDIVYIKDYDGSFTTNACTVARNGSNIRGGTDNFSLEKNNAGAVFIYVDATEGWQVFVDGSDNDAQQTFIAATGGTVTTCGNFKIHTFTGPGTFSITSVGCTGVNDKVDYLVLAGGGGGGGGPSLRAGGGGAGGYRESHSVPVSGCYTASPLATSTSLTVSAQDYPVTVGGSGSGNDRGCSGSNSVFDTITSAGGGGGGQGSVCTPANNGRDGGSGGGGGSGAPGPATYNTGGSGNTPPVSPSQGNDGGDAAHVSGSWAAGGGGGGAACAGSSASPISTPGGSAVAGNGGAGTTSSITGSAIARAGGGGGGSVGFPTCASPSTGGTGGGGDGSKCGANSGSGGTANSGGGGGARRTPASGYSGGSGIVIIRYKFQN